MPVRVTLTDGGGKRAERRRSAPSTRRVDATTRAIKLRASIPNKEDQLRPGMFVKVVVHAAATRRRWSPCRPPPSSTRSYGDSVFVVEDKKDEAGAPVKGADGKPGKVARQQFVRLGAARGDFVAITDGVKVGQELVTAGAFKLRNGSGVVVNNDVKPSPDPHTRTSRIAEASMKFTDIFIRRPVLAIVVNLVIIIAGLQAIRSLNVRQYPEARERDRHREHRLRGRQRRSGARLHHHAARARHRRRRRHRLHRVAERAGALDHQRPAQARTSTPPTRWPTSARASTRCATICRPRPRCRSSTSSRPTRSDRRRSTSASARRPRGEPDHRLPDARGAAAALGAGGRAARRHPGRPHLRDARLAQARPHGGAQRQPGAGARRRSAPTTTSRPSARPRARWSRST